MLQYIKSIKQVTLTLLVLLVAVTGYAQQKRVQPVWWFGQSGALNTNRYEGTTQMLNSTTTTSTAFNKGRGIKPYFSLLSEYRPNRTWGGMLNIAYDNRGGKFNTVIATCNCPADLSTNLSYVSVEPSLRLAPFSSALYLFAGPTLGINVANSFLSQQEKQADVRGEWSDIRRMVLSAQAGLGIDIPVSKPQSLTQMTISPFTSFQTNFGRDPRTVESWSLYTIRAGIALKFGTAKSKAQTVVNTEAPTPTPVVVTPAAEKDVNFSVRAPKVVPANRQVRETFPIRNSVFFNEGSSVIPDRYILLNRSQATSFKESQLQQGEPYNRDYGRSSRQLVAYYSILNLLGDRLRSNPQSTISLTGASENNPADGKAMAESIKTYLVSMFDIAASRITTTGRSKPVIPSEQPGATKELALLKEGDRRVDIESTSPELLLQVGRTAFLKPVEIKVIREDLLDTHVLFNVEGADELLKSWSVQVTDEKGTMQSFGPFTNNQASVPGKTILGNNASSNYTIVMTGETKTGKAVRKESSVSLVKVADTKPEGLRYSILFDFDKSKSIDSYEKFLTDVVAVNVPSNGTVLIHGYTDIIGDAKYNHTLSKERAVSAQRVIEKALARLGKTGVKFETFGFGEEESTTPFENNLPEKRFYNRTVIIDILPAN